MARFRFRLQRLLDHRADLEREAKEAFLSAMARSLQAEAELARSQQHLAVARASRPGSLHGILDHEAYINRLEDGVRAAEAVLAVLVGEAESLRETWLSRKRDREALDKLRDKRAQIWRTEESRREQAALDEWAVQRRAA